MSGSTCAEGACQLIAAIGYVVGGIAEPLANKIAAMHEALPVFFPMIAAMIGATAASFVGLLADRLPRIHGWGTKPELGLTLSSPSSHCDSCGEPIPWLALIPIVGWIHSEGRCRSCGARVPWIYPVSEAVCALISAAAIAWTGPLLSTWLLLLAAYILMFCGWIDLKSHEIPDGATVPLAFLGLIASPIEPDALSRIWGALTCGATVLLVFKVVGDLKRVDTMSLGDVALAGACGAWLGVCGGFTFLFAAVVAYLGYAVPLRSRGTLWVPMGPALGIGFLFVAVTGVRLL